MRDLKLYIDNKIMSRCCAHTIRVKDARNGDVHGMEAHFAFSSAAGAAQPNTVAMRAWLRLYFSIAQKLANITLHCERLLYCVEFTLRDFRPQPPPLPLPQEAGGSVPSSHSDTFFV